MASAVLEVPSTPADAGDDRLYEIVDGRRLEKSMGAYEVSLMSLLGMYLGHHCLTHDLGTAVVEMLFNFGIEGQPQRRPDVAFVSFEKWPKARKIPSENAWQVVPDLAVEVVSPTNTANEVEEKVVEYIKAGVRLVWVVHPTTSRVYVHDGSSTVKVVSRAEDLDGGGVLPGFQLPLSTLFSGDPA
jgi:Uma2 family endonuclease